MEIQSIFLAKCYQNLQIHRKIKQEFKVKLSVNKIKYNFNFFYSGKPTIWHSLWYYKFNPE